MENKLKELITLSVIFGFILLSKVSGDSKNSSLSLGAEKTWCLTYYKTQNCSVDRNFYSFYCEKY